MHDVIIIGGGPAGLTAAIYCGRYKLITKVIAKMVGGTISEAHKVCNYPGFKEITGFDLSTKINEHVDDIGVPIEFGEVTDIKKNNAGHFTVMTDDGEHDTKKIILAIGRTRRKLNIQGETEYKGKGISYCATCDGYFFKEKTVAVLGGGNSALTAALQLADIANEVYLIYRGTEFNKADEAWVEQVNSNTKIKVLFNNNIKEIKGDGDKLTTLILTNHDDLKLDGLFIEIGYQPNTEFYKKLGLETDNKGYVKIDNMCQTNINGIYAAGDFTTIPLKQAITAAGQGATAAYRVMLDIKKGD